MVRRFSFPDLSGFSGVFDEGEAVRGGRGWIGPIMDVQDGIYRRRSGCFRVLSHLDRKFGPNGTNSKGLGCEV
jgi:hypothetical protein